MKKFFEEDLVLEVDSNPFVDNQGKELSPLFDVMVDGITGKAGVGCFGGYSERIVIELDEEHPELGNHLQQNTSCLMKTKRVLSTGGMTINRLQ